MSLGTGSLLSCIYIIVEITIWFEYTDNNLFKFQISLFYQTLLDKYDLVKGYLFRMFGLICFGFVLQLR